MDKARWASTNILRDHRNAIEELIELDPSLGRTISEYVRYVLARSIREDANRVLMRALVESERLPREELVDALMERLQSKGAAGNEHPPAPGQ